MAGSTREFQSSVGKFSSPKHKRSPTSDLMKKQAAYLLTGGTGDWFHTSFSDFGGKLSAPKWSPTYLRYYETKTEYLHTRSAFSKAAPIGPRPTPTRQRSFYRTRASVYINTCGWWAPGAGHPLAIACRCMVHPIPRVPLPPPRVPFPPRPPARGSSPGPNLTKCRECAFTAFGNIHGYYEGKYIFTPFGIFSAMLRLYEPKCVQYIAYLLPVCGT